MSRAGPSRRRLFDAATREFAARGFAGGSVDRIAAAARLNKAMIYYHFGSKRRLYAEILRDMFHAVGERVRQVEASAALPPEKIRQFVAAIALEADARPHFPPIWFREIADGGRHLDAATIRQVAGIVMTLRRIIESGIHAGTFTRVDPLLVHGAIVGPLLLFFASRPLRERLAAAGVSGARFGPDEVVAHVQRVALHSLRGWGGEGAEVAPLAAHVDRRPVPDHSTAIGRRARRRDDREPRIVKRPRREQAARAKGRGR
jgi:AcrR family transcriptional regulator